MTRHVPAGSGHGRGAYVGRAQGAGRRVGNHPAYAVRPYTCTPSVAAGAVRAVRASMRRGLRCDVIRYGEERQWEVERYTGDSRSAWRC
ncbi:hypothetical protein GCM10027073_43140 [Streptomyces chlorus]